MQKIRKGNRKAEEDAEKKEENGERDFPVQQALNSSHKCFKQQKTQQEKNSQSCSPVLSHASLPHHKPSHPLLPQHYHQQQQQNSNNRNEISKFHPCSYPPHPLPFSSPPPIPSQNLHINHQQQQIKTHQQQNKNQKTNQGSINQKTEKKKEGEPPSQTPPRRSALHRCLL